MIHLKNISYYAETKSSATILSSDNATMSWETLSYETQRRIGFLLNYYGKQLPRQAAYISQNRIDIVPWLAAFTTLGISCTGIDYSLPTASIQDLLVEIESDLVIISSLHFPEIMGATFFTHEKPLVIDLDAPKPSDDDLHPRSAAIEVLRRIESMDLSPRAFRGVSFTSGTTGIPKSVWRDTPFDERRFSYFSKRYKFSSNDKFLLSMPMYHAAGNGWMRLFLSLGAPVYIASTNSILELTYALQMRSITATVLTPILLTQLLDANKRSDDDVAPLLRWLLVGGKHFSPALKYRALEQLGPCVYEYYGTTETGVNTIAEPKDIFSHPTSVGRAYDGNTIQILNDSGQCVAPMTVGSVAVASYMNMKSYGKSTAAEVNLDGTRFLVTPETGYLDSEGRLFLLNRSSRLGDHTRIYRIEDSIRCLPAVRDVAIIPSSETSNGFTCIVSRSKRFGDESRLRSQISELAETEEVSFDACHIVESIPYSPSGKVRLQKIREVLAEFGDISLTA